MRPNILVTGGAGFIGSHCCKALYHAGYQPIAYDNLIYGHNDAVKWGPLEIGDIADTNRLSAVIDEYRPKLAIHLAAYAYVGESVINPQKYYDNNVIGSIIFLNTLLKKSVSKIIFSSSCATYGIPKSIPIQEEMSQAPINPYGYTKLVFEKAIFDYHQAYDLKFVILRYFNAAGADLEGEIGESHDPETHAIPLAILAALKKAPKFKIFGTDYDTPDGTAVRDYVHVSDLAQAHVIATDYLLGKGESEAFNIGTGKGTSVREIIKATEKATSLPVPFEEAKRRDGDPPVLLASAEKARNVLRWHPKIVDIDLIVNSAALWFMHKYQF